MQNRLRQGKYRTHSNKKGNIVYTVRRMKEKEKAHDLEKQQEQGSTPSKHKGGLLTALRCGSIEHEKTITGMKEGKKKDKAQIRGENLKSRERSTEQKTSVKIVAKRTQKKRTMKTPMKQERNRTKAWNE